MERKSIKYGSTQRWRAGVKRKVSVDGREREGENGRSNETVSSTMAKIFVSSVTVHLLCGVHHFMPAPNCLRACLHVRVCYDPFLVVQLFGSKSVRLIHCSLACVTMISHLVTIPAEVAFCMRLSCPFSYVIWLLHRS